MPYIVILLSVIGIDQLTKYWVVNSFRLYESLPIIPGLFNLTYVTNTGAAFSMFAHYDSPWRHYFFVGVNTIAVLGFTIAHFRMRKEGNPYCFPFALIAGGAAGNVIDRLRYGSVVDFLDVYWGTHHWPTFNIADSAICVGVFLFIAVNYLEEKRKHSNNKE
jgi:signal peptidase II